MDNVGFKAIQMTVPVEKKISLDGESDVRHVCVLGHRAAMSIETFSKSSAKICISGTRLLRNVCKLFSKLNTRDSLYSIGKITVTDS